MRSSFFTYFKASILLLAFTACQHVDAAVEQTLTMIKPDAVAGRHIGEIITRCERARLHIIGIKMVTLSKEKAAVFYEAHQKRPFFPDLVNFITSGPVVALAIEGEDAVSKARELIGATNPLEAATGTLRYDYGTRLSRNAVHGSDSVEAGRREINFFFNKDEVAQKN